MFALVNVSDLFTGDNSRDQNQLRLFAALHGLACILRMRTVTLPGQPFVTVSSLPGLINIA